MDLTGHLLSIGPVRYAYIYLYAQAQEAHLTGQLPFVYYFPPLIQYSLAALCTTIDLVIK